MKQKGFGIYSITNTCTGDMYIGQTIRSFDERWRKHKNKLKNNKHENSMLQRAFNKYGEEAFEYNVIHLCEEIDRISELEIYYIKKYDSFNNGYNLTTGGEGCKCLNEESLYLMKNKVKQLSRDKSVYGVEQIEEVKVMLSKDVDLKLADRINEISIKTGVDKGTIYNIKNFNSWRDVREDLNEKILNNNRRSLVNKVIDSFICRKLTIKEICKLYNLSECTVRSYLNENNIELTEQNKINKQLKSEREIIKLFNEGYTTVKELELMTGYSRYIIHKVLDKNGTSIKKEKYKRKF